MPLVELKVSAPLDTNQKTAISKSLTTIVGKATGKGEQWVMVNVAENEFIFFQGSAEPCAYVNVKAYGNISDNGASEITQKVSALLKEQLGIPSGRVFVSFFGTQQWGFNGQNF